MQRRWIMVGGAAIAAALGIYLLADRAGAPAATAFQTAKAERGDIVATVSATGTINPTTTVIVGSQLSGQIVEILADYNSQVKAGDVVARLNSDQVKSKLDAARADLMQMRAQERVQQGQIEKVKADADKARAAQTDSEAQVTRNEALLGDSERIFQRQSDLRARGFAAEQAFDTARTNRDAQSAALSSTRAQVLSAKASIAGLAADLQVAEANLDAVKAQVLQREAAVRQIEVDLRNTEIRSPVSGVIVQRNVELGATVAASLQAPTLFLIADDLHRMEIAANIDETDVGRVAANQTVAFTVNAFPGRNFEGRVKQVRLGSQNVSNVVIYTTIVSIENPRLELLPGMTANLRIETERRDNVLKIPNAALRYRPPATVEVATATAANGNAAGAPTRSGNSARGGGARGFNDMLAALRAEAKLTSAQDEQIKGIMAEMRGSFMQMAEAEPAERRERMRTLREEISQRIGAILTPEQKPVFEAIRARATEQREGSTQSARIFVPGADGKPQTVAIRIGATDGGMTEVVSGLEDGKAVIIGGGARTGDAAQQRGGGRRLGF